MYNKRSFRNFRQVAMLLKLIDQIKSLSLQSTSHDDSGSNWYLCLIPGPWGMKIDKCPRINAQTHTYITKDNQQRLHSWSRNMRKKSRCKKDLRGAFNKFPDFFLHAFKIVVDSWKVSMLLLCIWWDDRLIFIILRSNEQLQQQLEYTLVNSVGKNYVGKNAIETYGMLQIAFRPSCMNRASVFQRHKRFKEGKEAVTKVTDTLTQEDFHGAFEKLLERYNKCIAAEGDYFEGD